MTANELDDKLNISAIQKGQIIENRIAEIITLSSNGNLTCYTPNTDDDGIDLILNPKLKFQPLFIQVKGRFVLNGKATFIQNVGLKTFAVNKVFYLIFVYFNQVSLEVETLWLIPSEDFERIAYLKAAGKTYKSFYRFAANPKSNKDKWCQYRVEKSDIGQKLLNAIYSIYKNDDSIGN